MGFFNFCRYIQSHHLYTNPFLITDIDLFFMNYKTVQCTKKLNLIYDIGMTIKINAYTVL